MTCGGSIASRREAAPLRPLAFRQIDQGIPRKDHGRDPVSLRSEARTVPMGPLANRCEVSLLGEFGKSLTPIVSNARGLLADVANQSRQERREIVAAPFMEFLEQV